VRRFIQEGRDLLEGKLEAQFPDPPVPHEEWKKPFMGYKDKFGKSLSGSKFAEAQWKKGVAYGRKYLTREQGFDIGKSAMDDARGMLKGTDFTVEMLRKEGLLMILPPELVNARHLVGHASAKISDTKQLYGRYDPFWGGAAAVGAAASRWWEGPKLKSWNKAVESKLKKEFPGK